MKTKLRIGLTPCFRSNFEETVDSQRYTIVTVQAMFCPHIHKWSFASLDVSKLDLNWFGVGISNSNWRPDRKISFKCRKNSQWTPIYIISMTLFLIQTQFDMPGLKSFKSKVHGWLMDEKMDACQNINFGIPSCTKFQSIG